jgi:hypothetical protein
MYNSFCKTLFPFLEILKIYIKILLVFCSQNSYVKFLIVFLFFLFSISTPDISSYYFLIRSLKIKITYKIRHEILWRRIQALQEDVTLTSDRADVINTIYISKIMLKVFCVRKLMQSADVNTFDGDNQLHLIFYLHLRFITSDKTDARFTFIFICSLKQILVFYRHITDETVCTSIYFPKSNAFLLSYFYFLIPNC